MASHAVQLRIQPLDKRPPIPVQIKIKAQAFRDMLAGGQSRFVKAVVPGAAEVAGIAIWMLFDGKTAQVEDGFVPAPPREQTKEDEEALVGVDTEFRKQLGATSNETRDEIMGDSKHWYLSLMVVDPKYQRQGIGQALLEWGLNQADAEGLEVYLESSDAGLRLYRKNGFEIVVWNELPDKQSEGGSLKWPALKRDP
ncbi:acyl-CoA N-acyltransferase [Mycena alexandri]|uniref:Acyl-CoA N-acyltransferase n=1 Tax=Mycena alexandri TaxID=1745969 RepID=A0AAD6X2N8_9AGAR|nr:acyl-CoA N-acyltransferase [Mycena alexandri]